MEAHEIPNQSHQAKVFSLSPLHKLITGPEVIATSYKSKTQPYRRRQGLFSFLGIGEVIEELKKDDEREELAMKARRSDVNLTEALTDS